MGRAEAEIIQILRQNGEAYQSDLARATGFSRATISEVLTSLERRKMVRRLKEGRNSKAVYVAGPRRSGKTLKLGFTRAAEYPFLVPLRRALKDDGVEIGFRVYDNGIGIVRDLASQTIDIGIAPLITLFMMHSLDAPFKIFGPAGSGGSSLMRSPKTGTRGREGFRAVCTRMSTMEMLMRSAEKHHDIPQIGSLSYANSAPEIEGALMSGSAEVCSIWEPFATMLEARGAKRMLRYSDLSDHVCCAAAAGNHLGDRALSRLSNRLAASMDAFKRDRDSCMDAYSALSGLASSMLRRVSGEYTYPAELSSDSVVDQLEVAGLTLPSPSSFRDALFRG